MWKSARAGLCAVAGLALGPPALAQRIPDIEPELALPTDPLERLEACGAYLTFGRAMFLSARPQTDESQAKAKDLETHAVETIAEAHRQAKAAGVADQAVDQAVQAKANTLSELTRDLARHTPSLAANTAICRDGAEKLRQARSAPPAQPGAAAPPAQAVGSKEEGDALLAAASASDLFENVSRSDTAIVLRHKASGLVCAFNPHNPANRVMLFPGVRGDDVGCNTAGPLSGARTWYAKRNTAGETLDQAFDGYVQTVKVMDKNAKPYAMPDKVAGSPLLKVLSSPKLPQSRTARFVDGVSYTSVTVALVKDWIVEFRSTVPLPLADMAAGSGEPAAIAVELLQMIGVAPPVQPPKAEATAVTTP